MNTQDFVGVPIMAVGGPYHGTGSPPEGDFFDEAYLQKLADAGNTYAGEIEAVLKVGHSQEQRLLKNSGLADDEKPAAGWLKNYRVQGGKLLADVTGVPDKLASLWRAGAFKKRSVEIRTLKSQKDGKPVTAVTALALLGAKAPAIRTLDDMLAHYASEHDDVTLAPATELLASDEPVEGDDVHTYALDDEDADKDDAATQVQALAWQMFTAFTEMNRTANPSNWRYTPIGEKEEKMPPKRDESSTMKITDLTDEQVRSLADTLGVEVEDEAKLREAVTDKVSGLVAETPGDGGEGDPAPPSTTPQPQPSAVNLSDEDIVKLKRDAALGVQAYEETRIGNRERLLKEAVDDGKLAPATLDHWRSFYDSDADACVKTVDSLQANPELLRALGQDGGGEGPDEEKQFDREYAAYASMMGLTVPEEGS